MRPRLDPEIAAAAAMAGETRAAAGAVDQRHAVEQHAGRQRAENEILEPGLGRTRVVAVECGDHVERQRLQLEPHVQGDQVVGRDHHQHADGGQQHEHRILEAGHALHLHEVLREHERDGRSEDSQHLHGAGEVVDDVGAAETADFARRAGHDEHAGHRQRQKGQRVDDLDADPAHDHAEHEQAHGGERQNDLGQRRNRVSDGSVCRRASALAFRQPDQVRLEPPRPHSVAGARSPIS